MHLVFIPLFPADPRQENYLSSHLLVVSVSAIYLIRVPGDKRCYVGQTSSIIQKRFRTHLSAHNLSQDTPLYRWLKTAISTNIIPTIEVLEDDVPRGSLGRREKRWIKKLKSQGVELLNSTSGGQGWDDLSPEAIEKRARAISVAKKGRPMDDNQKSNLSKSWGLSKGPLSEETKQKISARLTGIKRSPETIAKLKENRAKQVFGPEANEKRRQWNAAHKDLLSEAGKKGVAARVANGTLTDAMLYASRRNAALGAEARRGKHHTEETKVKMRAKRAEWFASMSSEEKERRNAALHSGRRAAAERRRQAKLQSSNTGAAEP